MADLFQEIEDSIKICTNCEDTGQIDDNDEPLTDDEKAFQILSEAVHLYKESLKGLMLSNRPEVLKEVAATTGVSATILLYASKFGILKAHMMFRREENLKPIVS